MSFLLGNVLSSCTFPYDLTLLTRVTGHPSLGFLTLELRKFSGGNAGV